MNLTYIKNIISVFVAVTLIVFSILIVAMSFMQYAVHYNDDIIPRLSPTYQNSISDLQANVDNMTPTSDAVIALFCGGFACFVFHKRDRNKLVVEG